MKICTGTYCAALFGKTRVNRHESTSKTFQNFVGLHVEVGPKHVDVGVCLEGCLSPALSF